MTLARVPVALRGAGPGVCFRHRPFLVMADEIKPLPIGQLSALTGHDWTETDLGALLGSMRKVARRNMIGDDELKSIAMDGLSGIGTVLKAMRDGELLFKRTDWVDLIRSHGLGGLLETTWVPLRNDWSLMFKLDVRGLDAAAPGIRSQILGSVGYRWNWLVGGNALRGSTIPLSFEFRSVPETIGFLAARFQHFPSRYWETHRDQPPPETDGEERNEAPGQPAAEPAIDQPEQHEQGRRLTEDILAFWKTCRADDKRILDAILRGDDTPDANAEKLRWLRVKARLARHLDARGHPVKEYLNISAPGMPNAGRVNRARKARDEITADIAEVRAGISRLHDELRWRVGHFLRRCNSVPGCVEALELDSTTDVRTQQGLRQRVVPIAEAAFAGTGKAKSFHSWNDLAPEAKGCINDLIDRMERGITATVAAAPFTQELRDSWAEVLRVQEELAAEREKLRQKATEAQAVSGKLSRENRRAEGDAHGA
jgi:hypothetical protein